MSAIHMERVLSCERRILRPRFAEKAACLKMLAETHAGKNFMHESFHKDDPADFTRSWFAWANALFAQMLASL